MRTASVLLTLAAFLALVSPATAEQPKSFALSPVPHPGKEARHESFNEISKMGEAELVFLGDSITQGWEGKGEEAWTRAWEPLKAANFGIGGDRTEHVLWRLENGNYDGLRPKLTVLMIGTNNTGHQGRAVAEHGGAVYSSTAEETAAGVAAIVAKLREQQPQMKILLLAIFPRGETPNDAMRRQNEATNQLIAKLDDGMSVFFMDVNNSFLEADGTLSKDIMPDLLHPNERGYETWTEAIEGRVKELLGE